MYSIYGDGICIYNDSFVDSKYKALSPKLNMTDNTAGSLSVTLPIVNAGYNLLKRLSSELIVYRDDVEIWSGRIITETKDFWNNRILTCEGELAYLNDTSQPPAEFHNQTVQQFLQTLITNHNNKVDDKKKFTVGVVTVSDNLYRFTNNESTLHCITDKLINRLGGHIRIRKVNGVRYLDYLQDFPNINPQEIRFGQNLLDFTRDWDDSELISVVMPRGARLDTSPIEALDAYLDVTSVNAGSRYVTNEDAIKLFGWVEGVIDWDDVTEPSNLLTKARDYLSKQQFDDMIIDVSALDLRYLNKDVQSINLLDRVRCISIPHGMDRLFPVTSLSIQLDKVDSAIYTLGEETQQNTTGSTSIRSGTGSLTQQLTNQPSAENILSDARQNSSNLINMATNGYVTIHRNVEAGRSESLTISAQPWNANPLKYWIWNANGLGYTNNGGVSYLTAITMDGTIVGQRIAAQSIMAQSMNIEYKQTLQNGGLATSLKFDGTGLSIYNGNLTIYDLPDTNPSRQAIFQYNTVARSLNLIGQITSNVATIAGVTYTCSLMVGTSLNNYQAVGTFIKTGNTVRSYSARTDDGYGAGQYQIFDDGHVVVLAGTNTVSTANLSFVCRSRYGSANIYVTSDNWGNSAGIMADEITIGNGRTDFYGEVYINGKQIG